MKAGPTLSREQMSPDELVRKAQRLLDENDRAQAKEALALATDQSRAIFTAYGMLGVLALLDGEAESAELAARSALSFDQNSALAHRTLGKALFEQGRFEEAVKSFLQAAAIHEEASTFVHVARSLTKLKRLFDVEDVCRKALSIDPSSTDAKILLANALRSKDREESRRLLLEVTETEPENANAWNELGSSFLDEMAYGEAEAAFRKAVAWSDHLWFRIHLAYCLFAQCRTDEAEVEYEEACLRNPHSPVAFRVKGAFLADTGRSEEAESALRKAINLDPSCPKSAYRLGKLLRRVRPGSEAEELIERARSAGVELKRGTGTG
jgi:tetratricopeptide (TPR) repeat protein